MIFVRALQANSQFLGKVLSSQIGGCPPGSGRTRRTRPGTRFVRRANCSTTRHLSRAHSSGWPWVSQPGKSRSGWASTTFMIVDGGIFAVF